MAAGLGGDDVWAARGLKDMTVENRIHDYY